MVSLLRRRDVAAIFQVTPKTIDNWCKNGILEYEVYPCGKRFDPNKIETFRHARSFGSPDLHINHDKGMTSVGQ